MELVPSSSAPHCVYLAQIALIYFSTTSQQIVSPLPVYGTGEENTEPKPSKSKEKLPLFSVGLASI